MPNPICTSAVIRIVIQYIHLVLTLIITRKHQHKIKQVLRRIYNTHIYTISQIVTHYSSIMLLNPVISTTDR